MMTICLEITFFLLRHSINLPTHVNKRLTTKNEKYVSDFLQRKKSKQTISLIYLYDSLSHEKQFIYRGRNQK